MDRTVLFIPSSLLPFAVPASLREVSRIGTALAKTPSTQRKRGILDRTFELLHDSMNPARTEQHSFEFRMLRIGHCETSGNLLFRAWH
jgi:hypothetical protein